MINQILLQGTISSDPKIEMFKSANMYLVFMLTVKDGNNHYAIACKAWNDKAKELSMIISKNTPVIVTGKLRGNKYIDGKSGQAVWGYEVKIYDCVPVTGTQKE